MLSRNLLAANRVNQADETPCQSAISSAIARMATSPRRHSSSSIILDDGTEFDISNLLLDDTRKQTKRTSLNSSTSTTTTVAMDNHGSSMTFLASTLLMDDDEESGGGDLDNSFCILERLPSHDHRRNQRRQPLGRSSSVESPRTTQRSFRQRQQQNLQQLLSPLPLHHTLSLPPSPPLEQPSPCPSIRRASSLLLPGFSYPSPEDLPQDHDDDEDGNNDGHQVNIDILLDMSHEQRQHQRKRGPILNAHQSFKETKNSGMTRNDTRVQFRDRMGSSQNAWSKKEQKCFGRTTKVVPDLASKINASNKFSKSSGTDRVGNQHGPARTHLQQEELHQGGDSISVSQLHSDESYAAMEKESDFLTVLTEDSFPHDSSDRHSRLRMTRSPSRNDRTDFDSATPTYSSSYRRGLQPFSQLRRSASDEGGDVLNTRSSGSLAASNKCQRRLRRWQTAVGPDLFRRHSTDNFHQPHGSIDIGKGKKNGGKEYDRPLVEISRGDFVPLRDSQETRDSIMAGQGAATTCLRCSLRLLCIETVDMVLCPSCRFIYPFESDMDTTRQRGRGVLGLGVKENDVLLEIIK